jgi:hypothetical protein
MAMVSAASLGAANEGELATIGAISPAAVTIETVADPCAIRIARARTKARSRRGRPDSARDRARTSPAPLAKRVFPRTPPAPVRRRIEALRLDFSMDEIKLMVSDQLKAWNESKESDE